MNEDDHTVTVNGRKYMTLEFAAHKMRRTVRTIEDWLREDGASKQFAMGHWWVAQADVQSAFRKRLTEQRTKRLMKRYSAKRDGT